MKIPKSQADKFVSEFSSSAPHEAMKIIYDYLPTDLRIDSSENLSSFQEFYKEVQKQLQETEVLYKANKLHPRECQVILFMKYNNI
jgi:hypothetical protein